jgi:uncharacterized protein YhdP
MEFANADASGNATGRYRTLPQGPGELELNAQVMRVDVARIHRYIPAVAGESVRQWLRSSLTKGKTDEVRLKINGNLAEFPFADGKGGQFSIVAKGRDLSLDYAKAWPAVTAADGEVRIEGARLTVDLARGRVADVPVGKARAEIADVRIAHPLLKIEGDVSAPTTDFLRFVSTSPVAGWIDHFTDNMKAAGNGRLDLKLEFPLGDPAANKVSGEYLFVNNQINLPGVPALTQVNGKLIFSDHDMRTQDLAVEVFGGPAKFAAVSASGRVRVNGSGASSVAAMRREYDVPYGDVVSGNLDWTFASDVSPQGSTWTLTSSMKGVVVDLPSPAGKASNDAIALKVERRLVAAQPNEDTINIDYGSVWRLLLHRKVAADAAAVDRALLLLGPAGVRGGDARADRPGLWLRGELASFNGDDWLTGPAPRHQREWRCGWTHIDGRRYRCRRARRIRPQVSRYEDRRAAGAGRLAPRFARARACGKRDVGRSQQQGTERPHRCTAGTIYATGIRCAGNLESRPVDCRRGEN